MNDITEVRNAIEEKLARLEKESSWIYEEIEQASLARLEKESSWIYEEIEQASRHLWDLEEKQDAVTKARDALSRYLDLVVQQGIQA